jgi:hypothetical protein
LELHGFSTGEFRDEHPALVLRKGLSSNEENLFLWRAITPPETLFPAARRSGLARAVG